MIGPALDRVFREASARIVGALASRFRDLDLAEDSFSEACARALETWADEGLPRDPAAWLFQVAVRCAVDTLRRRQTRKRFAHLEDDSVAEDPTQAWVEENSGLIPDERLRLIFICCHPSIAVESRSALTLRLVCGLSTTEIARAFLVPEPTLAQRLIRAKRKIAEAGIPFEVPGSSSWPERLDAVLSTLEIAYSKAHEDAAGSSPHAAYAKEMVELTRTLAELLPDEAEVLALAALVRFAEARRPARLDSQGRMVPISDQDPERWDQPLIREADDYLTRACRSKPFPPRVLQAAIHGVWCARESLAQPAPWPDVLRLYDKLIQLRDDPVVRLNRAVALGEVKGVEAALIEVRSLDMDRLQEFAPYHAVRADLLSRAGRSQEALAAYELAISLVTTRAERDWLREKRDALLVNPTRVAVP
jgi:RNA polymerase sigma-70 factor, ECF subfamily